jgi:hypothetical protein
VTHSDRPFNEAEIKHLEFIQTVITRLATNSFLMKGWALTVAGALFGFAAKGTDWKIALVGLMPVTAFWGLDAYFLRQERLFRILYDHVRKSEADIESFGMGAYRYSSEAPSWARTLISRTLWPFYGLILLIGIFLIVSLG